jgi:hypothetical protein
MRWEREMSLLGHIKLRTFFSDNFENIHTDHILTEEPARLASAMGGEVAIQTVR